MEVLLVVVLGGWITLALLGQHVHDDRSLRGEILCVAQREFEFAHIVTVDGSDVANTECLEEGWWLEEFSHGGFHGLHALLCLLTDDGKILQPGLETSLALDVQRVHSDARETLGELSGDAIGERGSRVLLDAVEFNQRTMGLGEVTDRRPGAMAPCDRLEIVGA